MHFKKVARGRKRRQLKKIGNKKKTIKRIGMGLHELFQGLGNLITSPVRLIKGLITGFPRPPPQPTGYEQQQQE